jgi:hypothetical protein
MIAVCPPQAQVFDRGPFHAVCNRIAMGDVRKTSRRSEIGECDLFSMVCCLQCGLIPVL